MASGKAETFAECQFYQDEICPSSIEKWRESVRDFVAFQLARGKRTVLITSGGTSVPLEKKMVRFLDNFSAGTRGSISAECFLERGYAVIFMFRQGSLQPYLRQFSQSKNGLLDFIETNGDLLQVKPDQSQMMSSVLTTVDRVKADNALMQIDYFTVNEYLHLLRLVTKEMQPLSTLAMCYLAAAVSDFYIPQDQLVTHKLQSDPNFEASSEVSTATRIDNGVLHVQMGPVPKVLGHINKLWAPESFVVSFKLETDPNILGTKSETALRKYGHNAVVGNILETRKRTVSLVSKSSRAQTAFDHSQINLSESSLAQGVEIENTIIDKLIEMHSECI